jgi:DNA-binding MarR family transcriptional regulator
MLMDRKDQETAYEIVWLLRRLFRALAALADDYLAESGLSAAERAVMEFLYPDEKLTVPAIASRYDVSRQYIQLQFNGLVGKGMLRAEPNPHHKRSPLLRLSELGRSSFAEIRDNEQAVIERVFRNVSRDELDTTRDTLRSLYDNLR